MQAPRTAALALALLVAVPAAAQTAAPRPIAAESSAGAAEAKGLHDQARVLYEQGQYHAAIEKLERALELDPGGTELVYNLAVLHEKLLEFDAAEAYYRHYLDIETDAKLRERALSTLKRIEGARRALSDRRAPGLRGPAAASAAPPVAAPLVVVAPASPGSRGPDVLVVTLGAVAGGAILVGGILGAAALATSPGDSAATGAGVGVEDLQAQAAHAHRLAVLADVSFLVGAVAGGTAVFAWLARGSHGAPTAPPAAAGGSLRVGLGPAGGRFQVTF